MLTVGVRAWLPLLAVLATAPWLASFPVAQLPLGPGLTLSCVLIAWRPALLLTLAAAALPVLDLAPWSGRWLADEYDMLLMLGCSIAWARLPPMRTGRSRSAGHSGSMPRHHHWGLALAFAVVLLVMSIGALRSAWPWPGIDANTISNPMSPLNGLRILKGAIWAALLWTLARRMAARGLNPASTFGWGLVLGLAGTVLAVLAERLAFTYLMEFGDGYRIAGPMSAMSLGGAYIECFIALATPFLLVRLLPPAPHWQMAAGAVLLAGASYALMVTFSRGGYAAMAIGVVVVLVAVLASPTRRWRRVLAGGAMAALAAAVAWPILTGSYAKQRIEAVSSDLGIRERHWAQGLHVMDSDATAVLFGMGLGRVPELFFWRATEGERAGGHRLLPAADGGTLLRLGAGYAYFIDQLVPVQPGANYTLSYKVQAGLPEGALLVELCQKWIVASADCTRPQLPRPVPTAAPTRPASAASAPTEWVTVSGPVHAPAAGPGRLPRPVRLTVHNESKQPIELSQLSLTDADGRELLQNGNFSAGMDHWNWTSDQHLAWHTKSLPLGLYVEQGLVGLAAMSTLLLLGALTAARAAREGAADAAAMLAALCAFGTVGAIDTLIDVPRYLMLWLLLCLLPGVVRCSTTQRIRPLTSRDRH